MPNVGLIPGVASWLGEDLAAAQTLGSRPEAARSPSEGRPAVRVNGGLRRSRRAVLTAGPLWGGLGVQLQALGEGVLEEVHVEVVVALHGLLRAQLEDVGEVASGVEAQIHHGVADAARDTWERERRSDVVRESRCCEINAPHSETHWQILFSFSSN